MSASVFFGAAFLGAGLSLSDESSESLTACFFAGRAFLGACFGASESESLLLFFLLGATLEMGFLFLLSETLEAVLDLGRLFGAFCSTDESLSSLLSITFLVGLTCFYCSFGIYFVVFN